VQGGVVPVATGDDADGDLRAPDGPRRHQGVRSGRSYAAPGTGHARYPHSTLPGASSRHHAYPFGPPSPAAGVLPYCQRRPGRRSCAQGRWPVARAPATGWTDHDRGPQADAEERITSAHRAIEIREKRRRVLSSRPAGITLALQPTSRQRGRHAPYRPADAQNAPLGAASMVTGTAYHNVPNGGSRAGPRPAIVTLRDCMSALIQSALHGRGQ
jgi:hypothetical protein